MKYKFYGEKFEFEIRDVYSKYGFGYDAHFTADFADQTIDLIIDELKHRNLPYEVIYYDDYPSFIEFKDEDGNVYGEDNEPEDIKKMMDELDDNDYETIYKIVEKRKDKEALEKAIKKEPDEFQAFLSALDSIEDEEK